jgi:predicted acyl esterase
LIRILASETVLFFGAADYVEVIEWAGTQPWSTGKVGLFGVSYLAISQWKVAALRPRFLSAICPWEGFTDVYRDLAYPGGVREDGFVPFWADMTEKAGRTSTSLRREQLARPLLDDFWKAATPDLERIEVPALICGSFSDQGLHTRGSFEAFRRIGSKERFLYTHRGGKWSTFYGAEALALQKRFFDCWFWRRSLITTASARSSPIAVVRSPDRPRRAGHRRRPRS